MSTTTKTSKTTSKTAAPKTHPDQATCDATYAFTGRGKTRVYYAALPTGAPVKAGDIVRLHTSYQGVNLGKLVTIASTDGDTDRWTFDRVSITAEQAAENRRLKAAKQAEYWGSEKGQETAAKIVARQARTDDQVATTIAEAAAPVIDQAPSATVSVDRVALISDLKAAGFSLADIMVEVAKLGATVQATPAPATPAPAPATAVSPALIKAAAAKQASKATPATPAAATPGSTSDRNRKPCGSCGKAVIKLYPHVAGVLVCDPCMNQDAATVTTRAARLAQKG